MDSLLEDLIFLLQQFEGDNRYKRIEYLKEFTGDTIRMLSACAYKYTNDKKLRADIEFELNERRRSD